MAERRKVGIKKEGKQLKHLHTYEKTLLERQNTCSRCSKMQDRVWLVPKTSEGEILICNDCYRDVLWIATRGLRGLKKNQKTGGDAMHAAVGRTRAR